MAILETLSYILPVIATFSVLLLICLNIYTKIRSKFPVEVNCWFCNTWLKVPYNKQNSWICPYCEQYNGFTADGDYNQPIPAQHDELMNKAVPLQTKTGLPSYNGLCNICNHNQRLKVHQLAAFSPLDEFKYDEEIERYEKQLERSYRLCPQCEKVLQFTLQKQKKLILDQQLKLKTNKISTKNKTTATKYIKYINYITIFIAILILMEVLLKCNLTKKYQRSLPILLIHTSLLTVREFLYDVVVSTSTYLQYFYNVFMEINLVNDIYKYLFNMTLLVTRNNRFYKFVDRVTILSILGIILEIMTIVLKKTVKKNNYLKLIAWNLSVLLPILMKFGVIYDFYLEIGQILISSLIIVLNSTIPVKRIKIKKSPIKKQNSPKMDITRNETPTVNQVTLFGDTQQETDNFNASFNSSRSISPFSTSTFAENGFSFFKSAKDCHIFGQKAIFENPLNFTKCEFRPISSPVNLNDTNSSQGSLNTSDETVRSNESASDITRFKPIEKELGEEFGKLHLGSFSMTVNKTHSAFHAANRPKPVLTPPKLITQSSWVAGGYWKPPYDYDGFTRSNLSRSSSQSSGFGSQCSQINSDMYNSLPNSRNNSICGEIDKFSVFSEPPYHSNRNTRVFTSLPVDQPIYICPRKKTSPVLNENWRTCDSNLSYRPNSRNSVLTPSVFSCNQSVVSDLRSASSISKRNGYSRGSLLNDWHKNFK